jgi:hypothetical protein
MKLMMKTILSPRFGSRDYERCGVHSIYHLRLEHRTALSIRQAFQESALFSDTHFLGLPLSDRGVMGLSSEQVVS